MKMKAFGVLLLSLAAVSLLRCTRDPQSEGYGKRHYEGRWNMVSLDQSYFDDGSLDSSRAFSNAGYFVLGLDKTFDDNPIFISEDLAQRLEMLDPLFDEGVLESVTNGAERRAFWSFDADETQYSIWAKDGTGWIFITVAAMAREKRKMTLTYTENGGPLDSKTLEETLVLERE